MISSLLSLFNDGHEVVHHATLFYDDVDLSEVLWIAAGERAHCIEYRLNHRPHTTRPRTTYTTVARSINVLSMAVPEHDKLDQLEATAKLYTI